MLDLRAIWQLSVTLPQHPYSVHTGHSPINKQKPKKEELRGKDKPRTHLSSPILEQVECSQSGNRAVVVEGSFFDQVRKNSRFSAQGGLASSQRQLHLCAFSPVSPPLPACHCRCFFCFFWVGGYLRSFDGCVKKKKKRKKGYELLLGVGLFWFTCLKRHCRDEITNLTSSGSLSEHV